MFGIERLNRNSVRTIKYFDRKFKPINTKCVQYMNMIDAKVTKNAIENGRVMSVTLRQVICYNDKLKT